MNHTRRFAFDEAEEGATSPEAAISTSEDLAAEPEAPAVPDWAPIVADIPLYASVSTFMQQVSSVVCTHAITMVALCMQPVFITLHTQAQASARVSEWGEVLRSTMQALVAFSSIDPQITASTVHETSSCHSAASCAR